MPADSYAVAIPVGDNYRPGYGQRRAAQDSGNQNPTSYGNQRGSLAAQGNRIDDTSLIREAQQGNRAAFEVLVRHYDQSVLRLALHLTGIGIRRAGRLSGGLPQGLQESRQFPV